MTPEVREWLALHRVHEGRVTVLDGVYLCAGRAVAAYLADEFAALIARGVLALGRSDPLGYRPVCVTYRGQRRYVALSAGQRYSAGPGEGGR